MRDHKAHVNRRLLLGGAQASLVASPCENQYCRNRGQHQCEQQPRAQPGLRAATPGNGR